MADMTSSSATVDKDNNEERPYIDLRIAQQLLDNYKATLLRNKQKAAAVEEKPSTPPATADEPAQRDTVGPQNGEHNHTQQQEHHTSATDGQHVPVAEAVKMFNRTSLNSTELRTSKDTASLSPTDENPPALPPVDARRQQSVAEDRASALLREPTYAVVKKARPSIPPHKVRVSAVGSEETAAAAAGSSEPADSGQTPATFQRHVEPIYSELVLKDPPSSPVAPSPVVAVAEAGAAHPSAVPASSSEKIDQLIYEDLSEHQEPSAAADDVTKHTEQDEREALDDYLETQASPTIRPREVILSAEQSQRKGGYTPLIFPTQNAAFRLSQPVPPHVESTEIPASVTSSHQQNVQIVSIASSSTPVTSDVTSVGVVNPIRFLVRPMGSLPMSAADLVPTRSAPAVTEHIITLTRGTGTAIKDAIYMWPTNADIGLQLSCKNLELVDLEKGTVLSSQPLRAIRLWGTGQGTESRDFAYVSRDPFGPQHLCHVFRCRAGFRAEQISATLRDVCWKMQSLKERSTTSPPGTLSKSSGGAGSAFHK